MADVQAGYPYPIARLRARRLKQKRPHLEAFRRLVLGAESAHLLLLIQVPASRVPLLAYN